MKLKILLVPFLIALGIALVVWVTLPFYYDDKLKRSEFENEENRLQEIKKKVEMASKLATELASKEDKQEILFSFLPEKQEDEEIINDLNNIASMEAISIEALTTTGKLNISTSVPTEESLGGETANKTLMQPKDFSINFTVKGEYGKIRNVIDRLAKLKRFNKIYSLEVSRDSEGQSAETASGNNLKAKILMSFYHLKKADAVNASSSIFNQGSFDMSIIEKINELRTINVLKIGSTSAGRTNPFMQ